MDKKPKVAVVGIGWWSQGWHLPHLHANPDVNLVAIVDQKDHPQSKLNPNLEPLSALSQKYNCRKYSSLEELLNNEELDGILLATPHATHYQLGKQVLDAKKKIHILMEKPMTTDASEAEKLYKAVKSKSHSLLVNHSANYRLQAKQARQIVQNGEIGKLRYVSAYFASPLKWIFEEPSHKGWNEPTEGMLGNGFAWGQLTHLVAWIYHVCDDLVPEQLTCQMVISEKTGADVALSASITCREGAVLSISGTSLLPGHAHSDPPVGKRVRIEIFGDQGALFYNGTDNDSSSGKLQVADINGNIKIVNDRFDFESLDNTGVGPESLQSWIMACKGDTDYYVGADCELGLKTVKTVAAMYESHHRHQVVQINSCQ